MASWPYVAWTSGKGSFSLMPTLWQHNNQIWLCFPRSETDDPREGKKRSVSTIVTLFWLWEIKLESYAKERVSLWHSGIHTSPQWVGDPLSFSALPRGLLVGRGLPTSWPLNFLVDESNKDSTEENTWRWKEKCQWNSSHSFVKNEMDRVPGQVLTMILTHTRCICG